MLKIKVDDELETVQDWLTQGVKSGAFATLGGSGNDGRSAKDEAEVLIDSLKRVRQALKKKRA